jgi:hypothetical protein
MVIDDLGSKCVRGYEKPVCMSFVLQEKFVENYILV